MLAEKQDYEIYAATLKERNRIAREIHDNVGHLLSRSILITGAAKAINASDALSPVLDDLDHSLNQAMTSIRTSVHDLHDESLNLKEAAESLTSDFTFCPVTLNYDMGLKFRGKSNDCFISIVKEALSNVARHSNATLVQITMREHPALYQLCIEDNGTLEEGLSLSENNREALFSSRGIGLSNMNDRLKILNGNLQITIQKASAFLSLSQKNRSIKVMNIVIIDDDIFVSGALKTILEASGDITVSATGTDGKDAVRLFRTYRPDVLLMDIRMKELSGLDASAEILKEFPDAKILLLTTFSDDEYIVRALKLGAKGYLLKQDYESLIPALHAVHSGQTVFEMKSFQDSGASSNRSGISSGRLRHQRTGA